MKWLSLTLPSSFLRRGMSLSLLLSGIRGELSPKGFKPARLLQSSLSSLSLSFSLSLSLSLSLSSLFVSFFLPLSLSSSLLCFALGQGERAVRFPRSCEQPRPPFWLTSAAVL